MFDQQNRILVWKCICLAPSALKAATAHAYVVTLENGFPKILNRRCLRHNGPMSTQSVREYFKSKGLEVSIVELNVSTATVALAAEAHGVEPGRIAKTLAFRLADGKSVLLVASGDSRIDNRKFKATLGKAKMVPLDEVENLTGHPVGGVCPFGLAEPPPIYLDQSLRAYDVVLPAAGSTTSAVRISTQLLADVTGGLWVDVCMENKTQ